ncbi:MAG: MASE1 domain-containing protein [Acidobacteria bacterium]|nr:MASE1 domain-containing protein [Acidobacteriota bacterium]
MTDALPRSPKPLTASDGVSDLSTPSARSTPRIAVRVAIVALAYFASREFAFLFPASHQILMAIWPPSGVALAAFLLSPRYLWPVVAGALVVGGTAADVLASGRPLLSTAGFLGASLVESLGCAWLIERWCGSRVRFARVREILALVAGALVVNAVSSMLGAGTATLTRTASFWDFYQTWWVSNGLGILLVTPVIVTWVEWRDQLEQLSGRRVVESVAFLTIWTGAGWLTFNAGPLVHASTPSPYLMAVLLAWPALRIGQRGVTLALAILAAVAVASHAIEAGPSPLGGETAYVRLLWLQVYLGITAITGFLLAASYAETRAAERHAREEQTRLRTLGDHIPDSIVYQVVRGHDGKMRFLYVSGGVEQLTGKSPQEVLDDPSALYGLIVDEDRATLAAAEEASAKDMAVLNTVVQFRRQDGQIRWMLFASSPRRLADGRILWDGIQTDVTTRRQAEQTLRESEERFRQLSDSAFEGLMFHEADVVIDVNDALIRMFWLGAKSNLIGQKASAVLPLTLESRSIIEERLRTKPSEPSEISAISPDGAVCFFEVVSRPGVFRGRDVRVVAVREITERKRAEAERDKLHDQLLQAQKMESVGRLAGGVAHDFNNMLGVILGHAELALEQLDPTQPLHADIDEIRRTAERSADLTKQLLAFARKQPVAPKVLDVNDTVAGMMKMLRRLIGEDIDLIWIPGVDVWPVRIDPVQVDQILANLCVNARDAISGIGKLTIETDNATIDAAYAAHHPGLAAGMYVTLAVSDDGAGMDEEVVAHLFEPFFTTKEMGRGTGLGLATVFGIVKQNDGYIDVKSEPGKGTTITTFLPRFSGVQSADATVAVAGMRRGRGETILFVEDDPALLTLGQTMLARMGYVVLPAGMPNEAIQFAERHPGTIDLLMTDVVMPEMNGRELAARVQELRPETRCLFVSGYTADVIAHRGILDEGVQFVQKPFTMQILSEKIRDALSHRA